MKLKYGYLSLVGALLLVSCAGKAASSSAFSSVISNGINWEEVYANNLEDYESAESESKETSALAKMNCSSGHSYDYSYAGSGLLIAESEEQTIFYSLIYSSSIFSVKLSKSLLNYSVREDSNIGFILTVRYCENTYVIDPFGRSVASSVYDYET